MSILLCTILVGCTTGSVRRFDEIDVQDKPSVSVLCNHPILCESEASYDSEYSALKKNFESAFSSKGFQVVSFEALDPNIDYLVVLDYGNKYNGNYVKAALVDYRSKKIVGLMNPGTFTGVSEQRIQEVVGDLLESPLTQPSEEISIK
ncbi:MAG: hypothetical protein HUK20_03420 [Fibrobacter sp.]|nr:hypothetical protein [Fibrobacter sp.]